MDSGRMGSSTVGAECRIWPERNKLISAGADIPSILPFRLVCNPNIFKFTLQSCAAYLSSNLRQQRGCYLWYNWENSPFLFCCPWAGQCVGAAELPPPLWCSTVLFKPVLHLQQCGLCCYFGTGRQMKFHILPWRLFLSQAWIKLEHGEAE